MGATFVFGDERILAIARLEGDEAEDLASALEEAVVVVEGEAEERSGLLEEAFFGAEAVFGFGFDVELKADGGSGGGELAFAGGKAEAEFVSEGAELFHDAFLQAEDGRAVEVFDGLGGELGVGFDDELAEGFSFASANESLGQVVVRLAMMMGKDFPGFAMGEDPGSVGGVNFFAIVAAIGTGSDTTADGFPSFIVAAVLAGFDAGEGVGNLVENGVEDFFFGIEGGEGAAERDFPFCGTADTKATFGIVQRACPTALSEPVFGELALQKVEGLVGVHGAPRFLDFL